MSFHATLNKNSKTMKESSWSAPDIINVETIENIYNSQTVSNFLASQNMINLMLEIQNIQVITFDEDTAIVTLEFHRVIDGVEKRGKQSQTWHKLSQGWTIVSARMSFLPG